MTVRIKNLTAEVSDYLKDESRRIGTAEKIVFPSSVEEIQAAVAEAHKEGWSITMQGGGTGITGGCVPNGGLVMNLSGMTRIQPIAHNRLTVEPGVTLLEVRDFLKKTDLFFPSDLTETAATLGGMVSTNASGARSFFYGSVRKWIDSMDVSSSSTASAQRSIRCSCRT